MSEIRDQLAGLRRAYPAVFEYRERLLRQIAQVEGDYLEAKERRSLKSDEQVLEAGYYDMFCQTLIPARQELEAVDKEIAELLALTPLDPMVIPYP